MFSFVSQLWNWVQNKTEKIDIKMSEENKSETKEQQSKKVYNVLLLGDEGVGKTSIIRRILGDRSFILPTIGMDKKIIEYDDFNCQVWDTSGKRSCQEMIWLMFSKIDLFVLIYDVSSTKSFDRVQEWQELLPEKAKCLLIANKADKPSLVRGAIQYAEKIGATFVAHSYQTTFDLSFFCNSL
jgi:small GTP-binding protein